MGFLSDLFGGPKKREVRNTTEAELNAIFVPLRKRVSDFRDATEISWMHIRPAAQKISVRLLVQARGLESVRRLYDVMISNFEGIPVSAHLNYSKPPIAPQRLAELNAMLWEVANQMIAKGHPVEHVAQGFGAFAVAVAEDVTHGDTWLVKAIMAETARDLQSDTYGI